ncbi:2-dehydro-3-deoxygalactonokinase [Oxalobacteraceae bacterium R-40]|uniref:2-dehydro-3-deoxygalactonokinase n=1 Tax=Keguizhuia sedimenti TaxID=3064264 RepID=A0ABU1BT23_9BURK|nr:2-dehydro-3-deoxygalactonokinase [Oxalobacteraceae bacterium R-40]
MNPSATHSTVPVLGIDWGTTNRRAYVFNHKGELIRQHSDAMGILAVKGNFEGSLRALLDKLELDEADVVMSGMVGSRNGWEEVPYLSVDRPILELPHAMREIDSGMPGVRCRIVPGYSFVNRHGLPDVMRGEETQVLGALRMGAEDDGWFVLPGTHSKWVAIEDGMITELMTFMTGEMYSLLTRQGTLSNLMHEQIDAPVAFRAGMAAARDGGFTHMAFACRALVVTGAMPATHAASFLSGLLIGAELHETSRRTHSGAGPDRPIVHVIGSETLAPKYQAALEFCDMVPRLWQPDQVFGSAVRFLAGFDQ